MEQSDIEDAAMFLLHLRTQRDQVAGLPGELAPKTIEDAYAIQDATHRFGGWPIDLLKVGCTSEAARQHLGIPHPIGGRLPTDAVFASGATVPADFLAGTPLLECEVALRIGANGQADAVALAIELVNPRFLDTSKVGGLSLIADNSAGCGAIVGDALSIDDAGDLSAIDVQLLADGNEIATGNTRALEGGPTSSLQWAVDHEKQRGRDLRPGMWVITGTCSGLTPTEFDTTYTADFGTLGSVSFTLAS